MNSLSPITSKNQDYLACSFCNVFYMKIFKSDPTCKQCYRCSSLVRFQSKYGGSNDLEQDGDPTLESIPANEPYIQAFDGSKNDACRFKFLDKSILKNIDTTKCIIICDTCISSFIQKNIIQELFFSYGSFMKNYNE